MHAFIDTTIPSKFVSVSMLAQDLPLCMWNGYVPQGRAPIEGNLNGQTSCHFLFFF